jgi:hypothetical protein
MGEDPKSSLLKSDLHIPMPQKIDLTRPISEQIHGARYNAGKPRYDHIPPEFLKALAELLTAGNMYKYADPAANNRNWEKGMDIGDCMRAALSHITEYNLGHKYDVDQAMPPGFKGHHLIHAAWNCMVAYVCEVRGIGTDSRPKLRAEEEVE